MTEHEEAVERAYRDAVVEAYGGRAGASSDGTFIAALAKRVTVKPEPLPKKVWSVSDATVQYYINLLGASSGISGSLNHVAPNIIRERPDLVAAEWDRRYRHAHGGSNINFHRRVLFPELDPL